MINRIFHLIRRIRELLIFYVFGGVAYGRAVGVKIGDNCRIYIRLTHTSLKSTWNDLMVRFYIYFFLKLTYSLIKYMVNSRLYKKGGIDKHLASYNYAVTKHSDTLFILGSGNSINDITKSEWDIIKSNDSMALNHWIHHDFVPTYYVHELNGDAGNYFKIMNEKKAQYRDTIFILKSVSSSIRNRKVIRNNLRKIPDEIKKNNYLITEFEIPGLNKDQIHKSIELLDCFGLFRARRKIIFSAQARGSLISMIVLGLQMGYKNIVLCGIDLEGKYFFELEKSGQTVEKLSLSQNHHVKSKRLKESIRTRKASNTHLTEDSIVGIPISEIVNELNSSIFPKYNCKLKMGTSIGKLCETIDEFKW